MRFSDTSAFTVEDDNTLQVKLGHRYRGQRGLDQRDHGALASSRNATTVALARQSGTEVSRAALLAVVVASVGILLYIAWAFREVPHPFRYGTQVIALVHDVLVSISFLGIMHFVAG